MEHIALLVFLRRILLYCFGNGLTYSVDDSAGPIVINVAGGSGGGGDCYTFTDSGGNTISLADGGFKFMRAEVIDL